MLLLPALLLGAWLTAELAGRMKADAEELLATGARAGALAVGRELESAVLLLGALSTSPNLDGGEAGFRAFHAQAREAIAPLESFLIFVRREEPRRQLVNSRLPFDAVRPTMLEGGASQETMRTGRPAFRPPIHLPGIEQELASVSVPVRRNGEVVGALAMPIQPARLGALLGQPTSSFGSIAFILASPDVPVASLWLRGDRMPTQIPRGFSEAIGARTRGLLRGQGPNGQVMLMAFERVPVSDWIVVLGATREEERQAWLDPAVNSAILVLLSILILSVVAGWVIRLLMRPLSALTSDAGHLPTGGVRVAEFEALAEAVAEAQNAPLREAGAARRAAETNLQLAREAENDRRLLKSVVQSVPEAIFVKDTELRYVLVNSVATQIRGTTEEAILGRTDNELLGTELARHFNATDRAILSGQGVQEYEITAAFPGHADEARTYFTVKAPWTDATGRIVGLVAVARDVTRRRTTEARLRDAEEAMRRISRADTLAAMSLGVAHELNQPLTAAANFLRAGIRWLQGDQPDAVRVAAAREAMQEAATQALRAGEILRRLRDFIDRGETERRAVSLGPLVADGVALVSAARGAVPLPITLDLSISGCLVMADEVQLQQVIVNLLRNAIEATEGMADRGLSVTLGREAGRAVLRFADAGPGLPAEVVERLFQPFVTTKETGMGIGLSICRAIVEAHGGHIEAGPRPGGGTVIRIDLPLSEVALAA